MTTYYASDFKDDSTKNSIYTYAVYAIGLSLLLLFIHLGIALTRDFHRFQEIQKGNYKTPWYDANWLVMPYTNYKLMGLPHNEFWARNGSEEWLVREVKVGSKTFWATVDRRQWSVFGGTDDLQPRPDGQCKFPHLCPLKFPQARRYELWGSFD